MQRLKSRNLCFSFLLIAVLTLSLVNIVQCQNSQAETEQAINEAENHINGAFISICVAEEAGAQVEDLIHELNAALNLTVTAHARVLSGDFSEATNLASSAMEIANTVNNQAEIRKQEALSMNFLQNYGTLIVLVIADIIICVVGVLLIHMWQRQSFIKKKPKLAR